MNAIKKKKNQEIQRYNQSPVNNYISAHKASLMQNLGDVLSEQNRFDLKKSIHYTNGVSKIKTAVKKAGTVNYIKFITIVGNMQILKSYI